LRYLYLSLIIFFTSCSLSKNSTYWNEDPKKKIVDYNKLSKIFKKTGDYKTMTFEEFNLFLKDYSNKAEYLDINK
tara:strand:- start:397 stop:621 length:225 start_codon:yes stop_codon:yes gene_type:complete